MCMPKSRQKRFGRRQPALLPAQEGQLDGAPERRRAPQRLHVEAAAGFRDTTRVGAALRGDGSSDGLRFEYSRFKFDADEAYGRSAAESSEKSRRFVGTGTAVSTCRSPRFRSVGRQEGPAAAWSPTWPRAASPTNVYASPRLRRGLAALLPTNVWLVATRARPALPCPYQRTPRPDPGRFDSMRR